jgi:hypothetical protein
MAERNAFPPQTVRQRLGAPYPYFRLEDTLVAGMGPGPFGGSKIRYVLYRTAETALMNVKHSGRWRQSEWPVSSSWALRAVRL